VIARDPTPPSIPPPPVRLDATWIAIFLAHLFGCVCALAFCLDFLCRVSARIDALQPSHRVSIVGHLPG